MLAKWLLTARDRIDSDEIQLTHDFLSHMLGTRRAGATIAIGSLALDGLIEQRRGGVRITDRAGWKSMPASATARFGRSHRFRQWGRR